MYKYLELNMSHVRIKPNTNASHVIYNCPSVSTKQSLLTKQSDTNTDLGS